MGFAFDETMAGTLGRVDSPDEHYPFRFRIAVRADSVLDHLRTGRAEITGEVEAPPLTRFSAPLHGELTIRPVLRRMIRYQFDFAGDDGHTYTFTGQKDIRWTDLVRTWTNMPGEIHDERGHLVATCEARFDLKEDWLSFISSFRPA